MKLRNDKIIIFGGGSGIGLAVAKRFCNAGADVLIIGRSEDKLLSAKEEIGSERLKIKVFDIFECEKHTSFFEEAEKILGGIGGFVNAAALGTHACTGRGYEPWDITPDEWDTLNDVNFKGAFFLMRNEIDYFFPKESKEIF